MKFTQSQSNFMKNLIYLFALIFLASCSPLTTKKTSIETPKISVQNAPVSDKKPVEVKPESNCNCLINLNHFVDKVTHNYSGFADKVNPKTEKKYAAMVDSLKIVATNSTTLRSCYDALETYRLFFYDKHLQLNADLPAETSNGSQSNSPVQTIWTKALVMNDLEKRKNALNSIEGVWNTEGYEVGVVFNEKEKVYEGVILSAENPNWKVGMVKFSSKMTTPTVYETVYRRGDMGADTLNMKVLKNYISIPKYGTWKKSFPMSKDTLTEDEQMAEMGDVQLKYLNDSTVYIALKSCAIELKPVLDALMKRNADRLKTIPNWIVDFRDNSGGDTGMYGSLLPYLYTKLGIGKGSKNWLTPDHVAKWETIIEKYKHLMDSSATAYMMKRVAEGKKNPNSWYDDGMDTTKFNKILPFPKKVAILSNENNGSSGETFLIDARAISDKVTIFGRNSAGYLDYGNLNQFDMPCDKFGINIPMRRANYLDSGESYDKNGYPPDVYIPKTNKNWIGFVQNYWAENPHPWQKIWTTEPYRGKQDDVTFIDAQTGWYVNGYGKIFHTKDGGNTWDTQLEKKGTFFRCIAFVDKNVGFAGTVGTDYFPDVTDTIPLYGTKDGGKTWNPVAYKGNYVKGLCAIDIVKEQYINHGEIAYKYHLFAVGRVGSPANSLISHDGGETWTSKSMNADCKMLFDIKMFNKKEGFACAATDEDIEKSNALILKTVDGGESWQKVYQSNRPFEGTWKAAFPSREVGYVTIQSYNPDTLVKQQRIAKTIDGGNTWKEINLVEDAGGGREFGIGFLDEKHGYVGTVNSGYETKDGGATWKKVDLGRACNKIRIYKNAKGESFGYSIGVNLFKMQ
jgi:photosystem II stability/assembly factor-like uncharacterized protein